VAHDDARVVPGEGFDDGQGAVSGCVDDGLKADVAAGERGTERSGDPGATL
jgi:hypothetical protein